MVARSRSRGAVLEESFGSYVTAMEWSVRDRDVGNGVDVKMLLEVQSPELKAAALASLLGLRLQSNFHFHITFVLP